MNSRHFLAMAVGFRSTATRIFLVMVWGSRFRETVTQVFLAMI